MFLSVCAELDKLLHKMNKRLGSDPVQVYSDEEQYLNILKSWKHKTEESAASFTSF